jgi:C2H2 zinc-finger/Zinc knuckle
VLNFSGKKEDWPTWSEKFQAKAKRSGIKDVLLGRVEIPRTQDPMDEGTEEGKRMLAIMDLNEITFTELILSIAATSSDGKIAFGIVKGCKTKEYEDGNAALAWEKMQKKYNSIFAPSLVRTERMFRESKLNKDEDPDVWITNLEDIRIKLEVMGSSMTDELQMLLLEKRIVDVNNPLTIEELKEELTLRFERMTSKTDSAKGKGSFDEKALLMGYLKGKCRNCGKLGHKTSQCKSRQIEETKNEVICSYCKKSGHVEANCFKLLKKNQSQGENNVSGLRNGVATTMTDVAFTSIENSKDLDKEIWIGDSGSSSHYCNDDKGLFHYKIISKEITVGNGDVMIAEKVGKLQCYVEQDDGGKVPIVVREPLHTLIVIL